MEINVSGLAFYLVYSSEVGEGYSIRRNVTDVSNPNFLKDLKKSTILSFLESPETKLKVVLDSNNDATIIAHNKCANESIRIDGLGDHFLALLKVVARAEEKLTDYQTKGDRNLLDHDFIKGVNRQLLSRRSEEVAIGDYRYLDLWGRPMEVHHTMVNDNNRNCVARSANIETSIDGNVIKKMDELVNWVNNEAFKEGRDPMLDIAQFHARFVQIQPFRDGNKRTARLLSNYLMLINNLPLLDINEENRDNYLACIYYASSPTEEIFRSENSMFEQFHDKVLAFQGPRTEDNKYVPLKIFFEHNLIKEDTNKIISDILRYDPGFYLYAEQITPESE